MKKKLFILLTTLTMLFIFGAVSASAAESGKCGDHLTWGLSDDFTLTISGYGPMYDFTAAYDGKPSPFAGTTNVRKVIIGNGVTSIGNYAFNSCQALGSVTIPDSVTSIGDSAFSGCSGLTTVTIGNGVRSIGVGAFSGCKLKTVTIPDSVRSIGRGAFRGCKGLTAVTITGSVTSIGDEAFDGCSNLDSLYITDLAAYLNISYGDDSTSNPMYYAKKLYINNNLEVNVVIPDGVKLIPAYAFSCDSIKSVTIPDSVTSIGSYAFKNCSGLTAVTIPDSVTSIGSGAFDDCSGLTTVTIGNGVTSIGWYAFYDCSGLTAVTIGNSVTSIGREAFRDCSKLTAVTIPDSVTSIEREAFKGCSGLTAVTIGNGVTSIGNDAFYNCSNLDSLYITDLAAYCNISYGNDYSKPMYYAKKLYINNKRAVDIVIPDGVKSIPNYAFYNCSGLTTVTIPDSVTSIGGSAFLGCSNLESLYITDLAAYLNISYGDYYSNPMYYAKNLYINNRLAVNVVIPDGVKSIPDYAFSCGTIKRITIPDSVTSIGREAFRDCSKLTAVSIPDSVTSIGSYAFYDCIGLTTVTIPDSVTSIGIGAFSGCNGLEEITLPFVGSSRTASGTVDAVFGYIFGYTGSSSTGTTQQYYSGRSSAYYYIPSSLKIVTITDTTQIPYGAFDDCSELTVITIPDSVTSIGGYAFRGCSGLATVNFNAINCTSMGSSSYPVFKDCSALRTVNIGENVTNIPAWAFYGCSSMESIIISKSVSDVGDYAFSNCTGLKNVYIEDLSKWCEIDFMYLSSTPMYYADNLYVNGELLTELVIPDGVTKIGLCAFYGCKHITSVKIPNSVTSIGSSAFRMCEGLKDIVIPNSVISFGRFAFKDSVNLESVKLSKNVQILSEEMFSGCSGLASITIPAGVISISKNAFYNCSGLKKIMYDGTEEDWAEISIDTGNDVLSEAEIICSNYTLKEPDVVKKLTGGMWKFTVTPEITVQNSVVYAAVYDDKGKITSTACVPLNMSGSTVVNTAKTDMDKTAKIFVWDSKMQPVTLVKDLDGLDIDPVVPIDVVLESAHPYANNTDKSYTYTYSSDCASIDVTFSSNTATESGYDYIYIYDANGTRIGKYSGTALAGETVNVPGNTIKIRITSDSSQTKYGFRTESIVVNR